MHLIIPFGGAWEEDPSGNAQEEDPNGTWLDATGTRQGHYPAGLLCLDTTTGQCSGVQLPKQGGQETGRAWPKIVQQRGHSLLVYAKDLQGHDALVLLSLDAAAALSVRCPEFAAFETLSMSGLSPSGHRAALVLEPDQVCFCDCPGGERVTVELPFDIEGMSWAPLESAVVCRGEDELAVLVAPCCWGLCARAFHGSLAGLRLL